MRKFDFINILSFVLLVTNLLLFTSCSFKEEFTGNSEIVPAPTPVKQIDKIQTREILIEQEKVKTPVKLFFIIDDSPSMEQFQEILKNSISGLLEAIGADFIGEIHSVTTTELLSGNTLPGNNLPPIIYPELQSNGLITMRTINTGSGTRYHGNLEKLLPTTGANGLILPVRQLFAFDNKDTYPSLFQAVDGQLKKKSILSVDTYQLVKSSLIGHSFAGGAGQVDRLRQTLQSAIIRGANGSANEQPYCALIHALKDTGHLSIFKPGDKVAFIFLQHGEADLIAGETCISGYEITAAPETNIYYGIETYATTYSGLIEERIDQNDQFRPSNSDHRLIVFDCDGTNSLCTPSPSEIANSKAAKAAYNTGLTTVQCNILENAAYEYYLKNTYPGKADFNNATGEAKKRYSGQCMKTFGFYGWPGSLSGLYPVALPVSNFGKPCSDPFVHTAIQSSVDLFKQSHPHTIVDSELCGPNSSSPYSLLNQNKKVFFEVNGQKLDASAGPTQFATALKALMDEKVGPANYIVTAITSLGTGTTPCDPLDFKASSLINLVNWLPHNHGTSTSLCDLNYIKALEPVSQFALFQAKRNYTLEQLPKTELLVHIQSISVTGLTREIALSQVSIATDRMSLKIDDSVVIQPTEKLVFEYLEEAK